VVEEEGTQPRFSSSFGEKLAGRTTTKTKKICCCSFNLGLEVVGQCNIKTKTS
jgi:hypothetical protein